MLCHFGDQCQQEKSLYQETQPASIFPDRRGWPLTAFSVSGPTQRLAAGGLKELRGQVIKVAQRISTMLGYTPA